MNKQKIILWTLICCTSILISCKKSEFLNKKPDTQITEPKTLTDFQQLLDNTEVMNYTGGLSQISADEQAVAYANYQTGTATERNAYIWASDIYDGDVAIRDWNSLYQQVFYSNVVLEGLVKTDSASSLSGQILKGSALFYRAYAFYDLVRNFCKVYDPNSAKEDLGIPLRISSGIDQIVQRSNLQASFDKIIADMTESVSLLPISRPVGNMNRPSKIAVYAFLARIYLDMRNYTQAESYADRCLSLYSTLIDYNTISSTSASPFSASNDELIYNTRQVATYSRTTQASPTSSAKVSAVLIALYGQNDLRLKHFYTAGADGSFTKKRGYNGSGLYNFTGLATDEVYLIKAECLARRSQVNLAMDKLNELMIKRFDKNTPYITLTASSSADALNVILLERRKELAWRGLRWHDLKRLNKEGANITLTRSVNDITYSLPPNDSRYVFPIPDDEIAQSGIEQNKRN